MKARITKICSARVRSNQDKTCRLVGFSSLLLLKICTKNWDRRDSNPRPRDYESPALPLRHSPRLFNFFTFYRGGGSLLPSLSKMIINHFLGRVPQSQIYWFWNLSAVVPTFPLRNDNQSFLRQSANSPR